MKDMLSQNARKEILIWNLLCAVIVACAQVEESVSAIQVSTAKTVQWLITVRKTVTCVVYVSTRNAFVILASVVNFANERNPAQELQTHALTEGCVSMGNVSANQDTVEHRAKL